MRTAFSLLLLPCALLVTSCAPSPPADTRVADAAALRALDEQWSAAAARNDVAAVIAFYAEDAVLLPPNAPIAADRASIRATWGGLLGPGATVSWKVSKAEAAKSGDLGYVYGTYQLSIHDPKGASPVSDTGKLVEIWKKQADGTWKCVVDTYNSDLPVPMPPKTKSKHWLF